jgi:hypothetical protein
MENWTTLIDMHVDASCYIANTLWLATGHWNTTKKLVLCTSLHAAQVFSDHLAWCAGWVCWSTLAPLVCWWVSVQSGLLDGEEQHTRGGVADSPEEESCIFISFIMHGRWGGGGGRGSIVHSWKAQNDIA